MSGFFKQPGVRTSTGSTLDPNVSQYGWTSFESQSISQIIEYVNQCKGFAQESAASSKVSRDAAALSEFFSNVAKNWAEQSEISYNKSREEADRSGRYADQSVEIYQGFLNIAANQRVLEIFDLKGNQTEVEFDKVVADAAFISINGQRVDSSYLVKDVDFTVTGVSKITLKRRYPTGTKLSAVQDIKKDDSVPGIAESDSIWNRKFVNLLVGATFQNYNDHGRELVPRLSYEGGQYLPVYNSREEVTFTALPVKQNNGDILVDTNKGSRRFSRNRAEAVSRGDMSQLNVSTYGVVGDGVTDDTQAFLFAVEDANNRGATLTMPGHFQIKLVGSQNIIIKTSIDFNHAIVDLTEYSGLIKVLRTKTGVTYDENSSVVQAMKRDAVITGSYIPGWADVKEVNDSFIRINTDEPFYRYRGSIRNRFELNKVNRNGVLESSFKYPLQTSTIKSVEVFPMEQRWVTISNVSFYTGSNDIVSEFFTVESSLIKLSNIRFIQDDFNNKIKNQTLFSLNWSCNVVLEDIAFEWATRSDASTGYTYNFSMSLCYGVNVIRMNGNGDGWGSTGSNSSQKVYFHSCNLSRIDYHEPFREILSLKDCHVGSWGVLVTALGDLVIEGGTLVWDQRPYRNNNGFIRSRDDTNGFCDGNLIVRGTKFRSNSPNTLAAIRHQRATDEGAVAGSPIKFCWWRTVTFDNISYEGAGQLNLGVLPVQDSNIRMCGTVNINNCVDGALIFDMGWNLGQIPFKDVPNPERGYLTTPNFIVNMTNVNLNYLSYVDRDPVPKVVTKIGMVNVGTNPGKTTGEFGLEVRGGGSLSAYNISTGGIDFYSGGTSTTPFKINIDSSKIIHNQEYNTGVVNGHTPNVEMSIQNTTVYTTNGVTSARSVFLGVAKNVSFFLGNDNKETSVALAQWGTGTTANLFPTGISNRNEAVLMTGYDSRNSVKVTRFRIPDPGRSVYVATSATDGVLLKRSDNGAVIEYIQTGTGDDPRYILSGD